MVYTCACHYIHILYCWAIKICVFTIAIAKSLQSCPTLCDPRDGSPPGFLSLGFSRQEHWSGLPFPSPMHESEKWKWSHSVMSNPQWPHGLQPSRLLHPWDFPGKSTGVGCHCLLRYLPYVGDNNLKKFFVSPFNPVSPPQNALYKNSGTLDILPEESCLNRSEQTQQINWVLLGTQYGL